MTAAPIATPGTDRESWSAFAHALTAPALAIAPAGSSEFHLPGRPSWHGRHADGLEAFARIFLIEAFADCRNPSLSPTAHSLLDGVAGGATPGPSGWIDPAQNAHALVEAPSLCLGLWVGGHRLWQGLSPTTQDAFANWAGSAADLFATRSNNWVLFPLVISRFLDSVGRPHPRRNDIQSHAARRLDELYRDGWYSDGGTATFDYYNAFAFHFYPGLLGVLAGDTALQEQSAERLTAFLPDLLALVAADGSPVYFGRSLSYRFGIAAPLSVAALLGVTAPSPSQLRTTTAAVIGHFARIGAVGVGDVLKPGWGRADVDLVQDYSGPGAAYWAGHVFANLLLPADHPYWSPGSSAAPAAGRVHRLERPNLLLAETGDRDVIRLSNHGSFDVNVTTVKHRPDDPFYGRLGYSSVTVPLIGADIADSTFTVRCGRRTYRRARLESLGGGRDWAASRGWLRDVESGADRTAPATMLSVAGTVWDVHVLLLPRWARRRRALVTFHGWCVDEDAVHGEAVKGLRGFTTTRRLSGERPRGRYRVSEVSGRSTRGVYAVAAWIGAAGSEPTAVPRLRATGWRRWRLEIDGMPTRHLRRRGGMLELEPEPAHD